MQMWACVLGILGLSASTLGLQFYYSKGAFRRSDDCNICFENDCLVFEEARCEYYTEAIHMINREKDEPEGPENLPMKREVDELVFDLVHKANGDSYMDCIPYVSQYTDCNKENVCLGCKTCSCNSAGKWNCNIAQPCLTQNFVLNIDHRVLVMVLENLIEAEKPKIWKRSVTDTPNHNGSKITLEEMSEWLYGAQPLSKQDYDPTASEITKTILVVKDNVTTGTSTTSEPELLTGLTTNQIATEGSSIIDKDYVAFDEVLRSIAVDNKIYNRRKLPMEYDLNNKTIDNMIMEEENVTRDNTADPLVYVIKFLQNEGSITESPVDETTKIIIDLLETVGRSNGNFNETQVFDFLNKDENIANAFENTNDIIEYNAVNIMKRDVSSITVPSMVPTVTLIVNTTTNTTNNTDTDQYIGLKDNVLTPLNNIINDKKKELENLKRIKKNLLSFLTLDNEVTEDITNENNANNTYFSIYNLAMTPERDIDLKRANPDGFDKLLFKLKTDIYEVIKDVMVIRKHKNSQVPDDLKLLMHAMKRYAYKNNINDGKTDKFKNRKKMNTRRQMEKQAFGLCDFISFRDCIIKIIDVIDKDMPKSNALSSLSPTAKRIISHIIKSFYETEFADVVLKVHDPQYNLTNDLNSVGNKWQEMTANIISGNPYVSIYRMKLLHLALTSDISKLRNALALVDFSHSRRMLHTLDTVNDKVLEKISTGLQAIHNKVQIIFRYYSKKPNLPITIRTRAEKVASTIPPIETELIDTRKKKKHSFIKHIRSLLKNSKHDIAELLHRKVPKSEIVKQLARKKLDEISEKKYNEYEETMKRWQLNLNVTPRIKRSVERFKSRIKNIIPNYLRHKVSPRIKQKKNNATSKGSPSGHKTEVNRKNTKKHDHMTKKTTTPRAIKSSDRVTKRVTKQTTRRASHTTVTKAKLNRVTKH